jgi:NitT/TauT family transport system ATP-binding protein
MKLDVNNISKYFGEGSYKKKAIDEVSFSISSGEFKTLVGSSGSGKSTILRIIAGLENPSKGNVKVDGKVVHGPGLDRGMVFQKYSLFPWLTAEENIAFGMNLNSYKLKEIKYRTSYLLEVVGLQDSANKYPKELSGGMQQRVGLARALATNTDIMLMDEAFSALDPLIRSDMQKQLIDFWKKTSLTVLLITHDIEEALALSQRICILAPNPGRIIKEVKVDLQKDDLNKLRLDPNFSKLRYELSDFLRSIQIN